VLFSLSFDNITLQCFQPIFIINRNDFALQHKRNQTSFSPLSPPFAKISKFPAVHRESLSTFLAKTSPMRAKTSPPYLRKHLRLSNFRLLTTSLRPRSFRTSLFKFAYVLEEIRPIFAYVLEDFSPNFAYVLEKHIIFVVEFQEVHHDTT
jgi:hypothetical protein